MGLFILLFFPIWPSVCLFWLMISLFYIPSHLFILLQCSFWNFTGFSWTFFCKWVFYFFFVLLYSFWFLFAVLCISVRYPFLNSFSIFIISFELHVCYTEVACFINFFQGNAQSFNWEWFLCSISPIFTLLSLEIYQLWSWRIIYVFCPSQPVLFSSW